MLFNCDSNLPQPFMSQRILSLSCSGFFEISRLLASNVPCFPHPSLRFPCHAAMTCQGCGESCCSDFAEARLGQIFSKNRQFSGCFQTLNGSTSLTRTLICAWFCQVCHNGQQLLAPMSLKPSFQYNHWPFWTILWFCDLVRLSSRRPFPLQ